MGAIGIVIVAAIVSGFVAGMLQVQLAISFNAHEEFIAVMMGQALFVIALALALLWSLVAFGTERAVTRVTLALVAVVIVGLAAIEAGAVLTGPPSPLSEIVAVDGPILLEAVAPALLAALIQWWLVRRHVRKRQLGTAHG